MLCRGLASFRTVNTSQELNLLQEAETIRPVATFVVPHHAALEPMVADTMAAGQQACWV